MFSFSKNSIFFLLSQIKVKPSNLYLYTAGNVPTRFFFSIENVTSNSDFFSLFKKRIEEICNFRKFVPIFLLTCKQVKEKCKI